MRVQILVLAFGWVLVGVVRDDGEASGIVEILRGHVVRIWGTSRGLGELVNGPLPGTKLDPLPSLEGSLRIPRASVVFPIECNPAGWARALGVEASK